MSILDKYIEMDGPKDVVIEASWDAITEGDLNTLEGEQFDTLRNVISITVGSDKVIFTTCRSIEAFKRGEPNAGRYTLEIERRHLQCIYIDKQTVYGRPGN